MAGCRLTGCSNTELECSGNWRKHNTCSGIPSTVSIFVTKWHCSKSHTFSWVRTSHFYHFRFYLITTCKIVCMVSCLLHSISPIKCKMYFKILFLRKNQNCVAPSSLFRSEYEISALNRNEVQFTNNHAAMLSRLRKISHSLSRFS